MLTLFGLGLPNLGWVGYAAIPLALYAIIQTIFKVDTKIENRRRLAIDIKDRLNENGFTLLNELFESYAVGDKSGMLKTLIELKKAVSDPVVFAAHMNRLFKIQLEKRVKDESTRIEIAKALKDVGVLEEAELAEKIAKNAAQ